MNQKFLGKYNRFAIIISSLLLLGSLLFPIWKIDLTAPQYPEGLSLKIWSNKLAGNIETVNGLNHYIGMKTLREEEFVEFKVLPWLLIFFSLTGLLTGILNNRKILYAWMVLFIIFAAFSMGDFYYWEYSYGHNLSPTAPIQVPGMAYQPPLLGYKQMLNFGAFSIPDIGGWFFIGSGFFMFMITFLEWKLSRVKKIKTSALSIAIILLFFTFISCDSEISPINYGKDDCSFCRMTIIDKKFGVEIETMKGKVYKFDDLGCAANFVNNKIIDINDIKNMYVSNYNGSGEMLNFKQVFIVKNALSKSPMGGNMASFKIKTDAENYIKSNGGELITSQSVIALK